jgi:hypothetical protein
VSAPAAALASCIGSLREAATNTATQAKARVLHLPTTRLRRPLSYSACRSLPFALSLYRSAEQEPHPFARNKCSIRLGERKYPLVNPSSEHLGALPNPVQTSKTLTSLGSSVKGPQGWRPEHLTPASANYKTLLYLTTLRNESRSSDTS